MNKPKLKEALANSTIEWRKHALERMLQRNISRVSVKKTIAFGEVIENYNNDIPFESALFLYIDTIPLHVVASFDEKKMIIYVITAYIPDSDNFEDDFKTRRNNESR